MGHTLTARCVAHPDVVSDDDCEVRGCKAFHGLADVPCGPWCRVYVDELGTVETEHRTPAGDVNDLADLYPIYLSEESR